MKQLACLMLIPLAACGGGGGGDAQAFIGLYQVTSHRANTGVDTVPCSDPGPEVGTPAYVRLVEDTFFEDPNILTLRECDTTDEATCTDVFDNFHGGGDGLLYENWNTADCQLYASRTEGTLTEGGMLHLEMRRWYAPATGSDCELEDAEALLDSPDCESVETWDAQTLTR